MRRAPASKRRGVKIAVRIFFAFREGQIDSLNATKITWAVTAKNCSFSIWAFDID